MRTHISPEKKAAVLKDIAAEMKTKDIAQKHGVGPSSIAKWRSGNKKSGAEPVQKGPAATSDLDRLLIRYAEKLLDLSERRVPSPGKVAVPAPAPASPPVGPEEAPNS